MYSILLIALKRKFTKEERELRGKYKLLARLMDPEEYEKFIGSIKKEKQLRQRIKELSRYRKNGITKLEGTSVQTLITLLMNDFVLVCVCVCVRMQRV